MPRGERFSVRLLDDEGVGGGERVTVEVGLDGLQVLTPDGGRPLRKYPLHHISRWSARGTSLILFTKSPVRGAGWDFGGAARGGRRAGCALARPWCLRSRRTCARGGLGGTRHASSPAPFSHTHTHIHTHHPPPRTRPNVPPRRWMSRTRR